MATLLLGVNHNTASIAVREKVAFTPERMHEALRRACREAGLSEIVIVSTCNRTELYCALPAAPRSEQERRAAADLVLSWLATWHHLRGEDLRDCVYVHWGADMVRHLMKVASGLDSMVLGEPQILGQIKSAYAVAKEAGTAAGALARVFEDSFTVAKRVRTDTAIGENPVSVAFAAVSLAQQIFSNLGRSNALMIGAGRTIELVVQHLKEAGVRNVVVANRTLEHALELKRKFGVSEVLLSDIPAELVHADIVVSSTASQLPLLGKGAVERALKARKHRPIFMVDLAVPRDIEPEVGELEDVYLYSVDDLRQVIDSNLESRQSAALEAEKIIEQGLAAYQQKQRSLDAVDTLKLLRGQAEAIRDEEVAKALKSLENGADPARVVASLARLLTNKLIHSPSVQLKKASAEGRREALDLARELFDLASEEDSAHRKAPADEPANGRREDSALRRKEVSGRQ